MALIQCPAPGCKEKVIDIWLTCPGCHCPIQVLLKAKLKREAEEAAQREAEHEARLEQEAQEQEERQLLAEQEETARLRGRLSERLEQQEAGDEEGDFLAADVSSLDQPQEMPVIERLVFVGRGAFGLGIGFGTGIPLLLDRPELAWFCGTAAVLLVISGVVIVQLATPKGS